MSAYLSPPEISKRLGVAQGKVLAWLRSGELKGCNVATNSTGRPRYRVLETDLAEFLDRRTASIVPKAERARRRRAPEGTAK